MHERAKFTQGLLDPARILTALDIRPGQTILDAGCGNGYMARQFSNSVGPSGTVYAVDRDPHFINILQAESQKDNIVPMQGDMTAMVPINAASVDVLYISAVLHIFSHHQMQGFLREADRLLKPGGHLAVVEIEKTETPFGPPLSSRYSPEELMALVPMTPEKTVMVGEHFYLQIFWKGEAKSIPSKRLEFGTQSEHP